MSESEFINDFYQGDDYRKFRLLQKIYRENKALKEKNEFLMKRDNKCQILEQRIKEAKDYLEYYLLDNLRYEESKKEFKRLLDILKEVD